VALAFNKKIFLRGSGDANWYLGQDSLGGENINLNGASTGSRAFQIRDSNSGNAVRLSINFGTGDSYYSGGNFGINTTAPSQTLDVAGTIVAQDHLVASYFTATSTDVASIFPYASTTAISTESLFATNILLGTVTGPLQAVDGVISATSSLAVVYGGTGQTNYTRGDILYANADNSLARLPISTNGLVLKLVGGVPAWAPDIAGGGGGSGSFSTTTDSLAIYPTDTASVFILGGNATTTSDAIFEATGNILVSGRGSFGNLLTMGSSTLQDVTAFNSTTTNATSTTLFATVLRADTLALGSALGIESGGTGLTTLPAYGQLLVGTDLGGYALMSTSTLGLLGSSTVSSLALNQVPRWDGSRFINGTVYDNGTNVGIGTTNPLAKLDIQSTPGTNSGDLVASFSSDDTWQSGFQIKNTSVANVWDFMIGGSTNYAIGSGNFAFYNGASTNFPLVMDNTNDNVYLVSVAGKVGIGTTTPSTLLSLGGTGSANGITFGGDPLANIYRLASGNIKTDGILNVGDQLNVGNNLDLTGNLYARGGLTLLNKASNSWLTFANRNTSGSEAVYDLTNVGTLTTSGAVGVGTSSPGQMLSVAGDILGNSIIGSYFTATSSEATSTFAGGIAGPGSFVVQSSSGYVGIGTTTPDVKLELDGSSATLGLKMVSLDSKGYAVAFGGSIPAWVDTTSPVARIDSTGNFVFDSGSGGDLYFNYDQGSRNTYFKGASMYFQNNSGTEMVIADDNVGIGTSTPGSLLSIGNTNGINFSTATSTFSSTGGINLTSGCFAVNGACITGGGGGGGGISAIGDPIGSASGGSVLFVDSGNLAQDNTNFYWDNTSKRLGIGTNSPGYPLDVNGEIHIGSGNLSVSTGGITAMSTIQGGTLTDGTFSVNSGTITGATGITSSGSITFSGLSGVMGSANAVCIQGGVLYDGGGTDCTASSQRFKHDIQTLSSAQGLTLVNALRPVSFTFNNDNSPHVGFIAEEVAALEPRLAVFEPASTTPHGVRYGEMTAVLAKAIQEQQVEIAELMRQASSTSSSSLTANIISAFQSLGIALSDTVARFKEVFIQTLHIEDKLCVDDVCIDKEGLKALIKNAGATVSTSGTNATSSVADTESPVITILGNNPAQILVGATYVDPGATVADNHDTNLGVHVFGDQIDTSVVGDHTVTYVATDTAGNTATSTRTVSVISSPVTPSSDTGGEIASSTTATTTSQ
jgi:hypothetical protein